MTKRKSKLLVHQYVYYADSMVMSPHAKLGIVICVVRTLQRLLRVFYSTTELV